MNTLLLSLTLITTATTITSADVTRCMVPVPPRQEMAKASAVFAGKVVGREFVRETHASGESIERLVIKIAVQRVWKGHISTEVMLYTSQTRSANGLIGFMDEDFTFDHGSEYLVYAFGKLDRLSTDACTRTRHLLNARDDLKQLGKGHAPRIPNNKEKN